MKLVICLAVVTSGGVDAVFECEGGCRSGEECAADYGPDRDVVGSPYCLSDSEDCGGPEDLGGATTVCLSEITEGDFDSVREYLERLYD